MGTTFAMYCAALAALGFLTGPAQGQRGARPNSPPHSPDAPPGVFGLYGVALLDDSSASDRRNCSLPDRPSDSAYQNAPWPGGTVPYRFDANVTSGQQAQALAAMDVIEAIAQIQFVPRTSESAFVHIRSGSANFATGIGYSGGVLTIELFNWSIQGVVIHELMHILGYFHEQSRPDRDAHVTIVDANIQPGTEHNFAIAPVARTAGPYDFESLMHYGKCAFSVCGACVPGCETILAPGHEDEIGNLAYVSALDAHGLRSLYDYPSWRFVDKSNPSAGDGSGVNPWRELSSAVSSAPSGSTVFVMPGDYALPSTWSTPLVVAAPVEGVRVN